MCGAACGIGKSTPRERKRRTERAVDGMAALEVWFIGIVQYMYHPTSTGYRLRQGSLIVACILPFVGRTAAQEPD